MKPMLNLFKPFQSYLSQLFQGKKNIFFTLLFLFIALFIYTFILCILGAFKINESNLGRFLFSSSGPMVYSIEGKSQGITSLANDFDIYTAINFPARLSELAKNSNTNWADYIKMREKQDIIIFEALESSLLKDPNALFLVRQGLRDSIIKAYLYKTIPNIEKIKESKFSEDRIFLEEIYAKNKESYDKKNISKDEAIKALEQVYAQKKSAIIDYLLKKEETKILNQLEKKYKIKENTELMSKKVVHESQKK